MTIANDEIFVDLLEKCVDATAKYHNSRDANGLLKTIIATNDLVVYLDKLISYYDGLENELLC